MAANEDEAARRHRLTGDGRRRVLGAHRPGVSSWRPVSYSEGVTVINDVCFFCMRPDSGRWPATANWPLIFTKPFLLPFQKNKNKKNFSAGCS